MKTYVLMKIWWIPYGAVELPMFELLHEMDCCDFELNVVRLISEYEPLSDEWELFESGAENTAPALFQYLTHDEKQLIVFLGALHLNSVLGENIESFFQERIEVMLNKADEAET